MQKAYLRELNFSNQCELVFPLKLTNDKMEIIIEKEIRSVRQITDSVQSLLDHTKNKINKLLQGKPKEVTISLTHNGINVAGETQCKIFIEEYQNVLLTVCEEIFELYMNTPLVQSAILPTMIYIDYDVHPLKFKTLHASRGLCKYFWYNSPDKISWTKVGSTLKYKPTPNDENKYLKFCCIPKNIHVEGPPFEIVSEMPVKKMPPIPFMKRLQHTLTNLGGKDIRIVCYNTLSTRYSETKHFPYCSPLALSIEYRKRLILKELIGYNADIICLQELDLSFYQNYFKPNLAHKYKSMFQRKGNRLSEGLACFYNADRFKLLETIQVVLASEIEKNKSYKVKWDIIKQSNTLKEGLLKQPTSLQVTILKLMEFNEIIIVANTHLYYHCEANHVRLLQASIALDLIKDVFNYYKRSYKQSKVSVIFCGDFNSVPTSLVYDLFIQKVIQHSFIIEDERPIRDICFHHPFNFASAYGTPKYTNYTDDFKGCLDYIFYDKDRFRVNNCVPLPEESVLAEQIGLPNEVFPSDHIALVADLKLL